MASIHKRGERYRLVWRDHVGRQRERTFATKGEAKDFRALVEPEERRREAPEVPRAITMGDYAERWLRIVKPTIEAATYDGYQRAINLHVLPQMKRYRVADLRQGHVRQCIAALMAGGMSRETARRVHATLRLMLGLAVQDRLLRDNPASGLGRVLRLGKSKREKQDEIHPLTMKERDDLHAAALKRPFTDLAPMLFTMERSGLRLGEAIALRLSHVDLRNEKIRVCRSLSNFNRQEKAPKSGVAREVHMSPALTSLLTRVVAERRKAGLKQGQKTPSSFLRGAGPTTTTATWTGASSGSWPPQGCRCTTPRTTSGIPSLRSSWRPGWTSPTSNSRSATRTFP